MDVGSFFLTGEGYRWIRDLGGDAYTLTNYFQDAEGGARWNYYRCRAEGHNTLVLNADASGGQRRDGGIGVIEQVRSEATEGVSRADLTAAYLHEATKVERGVRSIENRSRFVIQDEVTGLTSPGTIHWHAHYETAGNTVTLPNGGYAGQEALLTRADGTRLFLRILSPGGAVFTDVTATPMTGAPYNSPNPSGQDANSDYKKLRIVLTGRAGDTTLSVYMAPLANGEAVPTSFPSVTPLESW
jgi:hypothetical protein